MRLAEFILANVEPILVEWEAFARGLAPGGKMGKFALRDDAEQILRATARDMGTDQTLAQQARKSMGYGGAGGAASDRIDSASSLHGVGRVGSGFDLMEVVSEYRALRASVLRLWRQSRPSPDQRDLDDITRFNESIDQSLGKAVEAYTRRVDQSRRMFLAILGHDLRNPLNTIMQSAHLVAVTQKGNPESSEAMSHIEKSAEVIAQLVNDLLDFASTGLGAAMPLAPAPVNLRTLCRDVFEEFRAAHRERALRLACDGDLSGAWDAARLRQVISNLLGNALQHGSASGPIELIGRAEGADVVIAVRNQGRPIPADALPTIFDPLVRGPVGPGAPGAPHAPRAGGIGLGLYIAREIVAAHHGTIEVESSAEAGTTFTVRLPREQATE
jgi:signal transduction histidine kinase